MKKIVFDKLILVLGLLIVLASCNKEGNNTRSTEILNPENNKMCYSENWLNEALKNEFYGYSVKQTIDISKDKRFFAYVLSAPINNDIVCHNAKLAVETADYVYIVNLTEERVNVSYATFAYACDIDGDDADEIIVQQTIGSSGGAGQYYSRGYKVNKDSVKEIFNSFDFDSGFSSVFNKTRMIIVKNEFTDYELLIDLNDDERYADFYFNEEGTPISTTEIHCDSFNEFVPTDIDSDGVFEIVCKQYVSLMGHSDYFGDAKCVLKFNTKTQAFEVIDASFSYNKPDTN